MVDRDFNDLATEISHILEKCKIYYYGFNLLRSSEMLYRLGNIDGETDITRVMKMKALW
mgnify:CR=1 FL=1